MNEMNTPLPISVVTATSASKQVVWAGEVFGRQVFPRLVELVQGLEGALCVVDLKGIEVITASAFRSTMRALRNHVFDLFHVPTVFANATVVTMEEASYVASKFAETYVFAELRGSEVADLQLVGTLDEPLKQTLEQLRILGPCDAKTLHAKVGVPGITAWHNRLAELEAKGLAVPCSSGRSKMYRSLL